MWAKVCKTQETCTQNSLLSNLQILFGIYQVSTHHIVRYLGTICKLISFFKSGGQEFLTPIINLIAVHNLEPSRYQKVLGRY